MYSLVPDVVWNIAAFGKKYEITDPSEWSQTHIHVDSDFPATVSNAENRTTLYGAVDMLGNVWEWCKKSEEAVERFSSVAAAPEFELRGGG